MAAAPVLAAASLPASAAQAPAPDSTQLPTVPVARRTTMGLTSDSFQSIRFASPHRLLEVDRLMDIARQVGAAGAHGGMTQIDMAWAEGARRLKGDLDMYSEVQTFLPRVGEDPAVFENAVRVAKAAGATSLRVVCLLGRRYEMFDTVAQWKAAVADYHKQIEVALPIVERPRMPLGIENHKDWRVDQQVELHKRYSSEFLGVTLDTGNNMSVLDDPMETIEKLAPYTVNVHLKDMAVQEYEQGFLLSEVALGEGMLDVKRMVDTVRKAKPDVKFSLEMITRDPLEVPCLTDKYWAAFDEVNGVFLARMMAAVKVNPPKQPLPRITGLTPEGRLALETELVRRSITYAREHLRLA
ncbi:MAG: sugar phosphate isomerase/epimerase [Chloroflexota bacterium]|nr:sugar phosphate isomerase/epimerase [Chloroflexota bacterium]